MRQIPQLFMKANKKKKKNILAVRLIAIGFLGIILIGALILMLPISSATGQITNFFDALFTATTSVCVTGLVTVTTATHWSLFGKIVILCLIQIGGLGVVTVMMVFFIVIGRRITMKERILIQEAYNLDTIQGMVKFIHKILRITVIVEGCGAIGYLFVFIPRYGLIKGIFYSIFHSISAFCNAGIDIIGENSLESYVTHPFMNFVTICLIVFGGLGFTVIWDIYEVVKKYRKFRFEKLQFHSKIVLTTTVVLISVGAVLYFILEYHNEKTIGNFNMGDKIIASLFQSVTTRTAGFAAMNQANLTRGSAWITIVLMFIGGSPASTAGGMKTTSAAVLVLTIRSMIKGRESTEAFGRCISENSVRTALSVFALGFTILFCGTTILCITEDADLSLILFETASAMGTSGLSAGLSANLSTIGKVVVIMIMYAGRIGPITIVMAVLHRRKDTHSIIELPEGKVIIG